MLLKELLGHSKTQIVSTKPNYNAHSTLTIKNSTLPQYPGQLIQRSHQHSSVKHIQQRLNALGYQPALSVDNLFGAKTEQAVQWFQASSLLANTPLKVDGIAGPKTWQALFNAKLF